MSLVRRDLVVVGASAGGVEALRALVRGLPADFPAAVVVVLHLPSGGTSGLAAILGRSGPLPAVQATDGTPLQPGRVHVAPPDHHLLVRDGQLRLSHGPTESGHRPAVDALFRSAARSRGPRVVGVVLSGVLDDGSAGLVAIASRGGATVVQDPGDALYDGMPRAAMRLVQVDHVVPADDLGKVLAERVGDLVDPARSPELSPLEQVEADIAERGDAGLSNKVGRMGAESGLSCPDCQGSLVRLADAPSRYRCRVGHAWTEDALLSEQSVTLERALWAALRMLEERGALARRLAAAAGDRVDPVMARRYGESVRESEASAAVLRRVLLSGLPENGTGAQVG